MASGSLKNIILEWMSTTTCLKRASKTLAIFFKPDVDLPTQSNNNKNKLLELFLAKYPGQLEDFGVLCKRITCLSHTRKRLSFAMEAFFQLIGFHTNTLKLKMLKNETQQFAVEWIQVINLIHFMKMLHTFARGWDESEFVPVIKLIAKDFGLNKTLKTVSKIHFTLDS